MEVLCHATQLFQTSSFKKNDWSLFSLTSFCMSLKENLLVNGSMKIFNFAGTLFLLSFICFLFWVQALARFVGAHLAISLDCKPFVLVAYCQITDVWLLEPSQKHGRGLNVAKVESLSLDLSVDDQEDIISLCFSLCSAMLMHVKGLVGILLKHFLHV